MGLDFVRKAARSFHKGLDRNRIELGTPDLFTQEPTAAPRTYAAVFRTGQTLTPGEKLGVHLEGEAVVLMRGLNPVATFDRPSTELIKALSDSHGEACGVVQQVHDMAQMAEVNVC